MYAEERQSAIVAWARELGRVSVADLATRFGVTAETIRRDLDALARDGLLSRVHGGAVPPDKLPRGEAPVGAREVAAQPEKLAIATRAVGVLPEGRELTVLLDSGTTTAKLCGLLPERVGTVFTNSVRIAGVLAERPGIEVFLLGGRVRGVTQAIVGAEAHAMLAKLRVDVAFMGTNGISVEHGFSTPDPAEAAMKEAMVRAARHVYVLADSTKFGSDEAVRFAELSDVDGLVTDERLAPGARAALEAAGLEVTLA